MEQQKRQSSLSAQASENLDYITDLIAQDSKFVKVRPSEKIIQHFNPEKVEMIDDTYNNAPIGKRYVFMVTDPNDVSRREKIFKVAKKTALKIIAELKKGHRTLYIERIGEGTNTVYNISPAD